MATPMPEMARIYLDEFALLDKALADLDDELDKMWEMTCDEVAEQLEQTASKYGRKLRSMEDARNKSSPGDYWIRSEDNQASLQVRVRDPRCSNPKGKYIIDLSFPKSSQAEIKQTKGAVAQFERFWKAENFDQLRWRSSPPWSRTTAVRTDNIEDTVSEVGDVVVRLYKVIAQFEQWLLTQPKRKSTP